MFHVKHWNMYCKIRKPKKQIVLPELIPIEVEKLIV